MPWEPDPDRAVKVGWTAAALALLIAIVSAIGEYRGWWGLIGQLGMTFGTITSVLLGLATYFYGAGKGQLEAVYRAVVDNGTVLGSVDTKLDKLDVIEDALVAEDGETSRLDIVQVELDRQTGVLDRQLSVLGEIRDAL